MLAFIFSCSSEKNAVVKGSAEVFRPGDTLRFSNRPLDGFPLDKFFKYTAVVDSNKNFSVNIPMKQKGFVSLSLGLTFYTAPQDTVSFSVEGSNSIVFKGKYANLNNAYIGLVMNFGVLFNGVVSKYLSRENNKLLYDVAIVKDIDAALDEKKESLIKEHNLNEEEIGIFNGVIEGYKEQMKLFVTFSYPKEDYQAVVQEEKELFTKIKVSQQNAESFPSFLNTIYFKTIESVVRDGGNMANLNVDNFVKDVKGYDLNASMKDDLYAYAAFMLLSNVNNEASFQEAEKNADVLLENMKDNDNKQIIRSLYADAKTYFVPAVAPTESENELPSPAKDTSVSGGQELPDVSFQDINGKNVSLKDYLNKVVFLDFWASWCSPCIDAIPLLKSIEKEYSKKGVVFISVSIDSTVAQWKKAVSRHQPAGSPWYAGTDNEEINDIFGLHQIPVFFVVNKKGLLFSAPHLSDPDFRPFLERFINE